MIRMMVTAIAAAAALSAAPAAAQSGELGWMLGKWCVHAPEQGLTVCLDFEAQDDGSVSAEWSSQATGEAAELSKAVLRIEDGRVVLHSDDENSTYTEVSRGPDELTLQNTNPDGELQRVRYSLSKGELLLAFDFIGDDRDGTMRYTRER